MSTKFYQLTNLPPLPQTCIAEALADGFEFTTSPFAYAKPASAFYATDLYSVLKNHFGTVGCKYLKNPPNSYYDWHTDKIRNCALNWVIKTNPGAKTFYRSDNHDRFFWDLEEVAYDTTCPTLIDTKQEHCVFNNYNEDRIILTVTILDHSYQHVLDFLTAL